MNRILVFLLWVMCPLTVWSQHIVNTGPISTSTVQGLKVLLSPAHPIHVESGDDLPVDFTSVADLNVQTKIYNQCHYRISAYFVNTSSTSKTLRFSCVWDAAQMNIGGYPVPAEWWSIDDKPNAVEGDDNYGEANKIPKTNGGEITIAGGDTVLLEFYDPIVKLIPTRQLSVRFIAITGTSNNYIYEPIRIQGISTSKIPADDILSSSCAFILSECIVASPNPTIVDGNLTVTAIVENTSANPVRADLYIRLRQGNVEQDIDYETGQTYDSDELVIFNNTIATTLTANFVPGPAEIFVEYELTPGNPTLVKEYFCQNPIPIMIEDPCATGLVPELVGPGTASTIPIQKITTLTPTFLWKKICAANSGVTGYRVDVVDYLSNAPIASFNVVGAGNNQQLAPGGTFRYSTQYTWTVTALSPNGNQTSTPFYFETPGPDNPNCQVTDIDQVVDPLLWDAVQYLCERGIVTPREWISGGAQYDVQPTHEIVREHLAWIAAAGLYGSRTDVENAYFYTNRYPIPFEDLAQAANNRDRYAKLLTFLDYGDEITPYDGDRHNFQPANRIPIKFALKVLLETFNINVVNPPTTLGSVLISSTDPMYKYVAVATQLGLLDHYTPGTSADTEIKRSDAFIILYLIMTHAGLTHPTIADLSLEANFVESNFYGANNYAIRPSVADGNFSSYSKTSFAIPGTAIPLVFGHSYASSSQTLPEEIFPMCPVGKGWTHNHHGYIIETDGANNWGGNDRLAPGQFSTSIAIFFPGSQHPHIFRRDNTGVLVAATKGLNYRITEDVVNNRIVIETIDRSRMVFEKLPANTHFDNVYMLKEVSEKNGNKLLYSYVTYTASPNVTRSHLTQVCAHYLDVSGNPVPPRCIDLIYYNVNPEFLERVEYPSPTGGTPRQITFTYDFGQKDLTSYKDALPAMPCTGQSLAPELYFYDPNPEAPHLLNTIQLPKGNFIRNQYHDRKLKSTRLMAGSQILNQTDIDVQYNPLSGKRDQTVTSSAGSGNVTSMTQVRNDLGYITASNYLRSDGQYDNFTIEYGDPIYPQNATRVDAYGVITEMNYNAAGQMTEKDVISSVLGVTYTEQWNYGTDSLLQSYTNRRGHAMYYQYDARKNLTKVTDFENQDTDYEYYPNGLPKKVTTPTQKEYQFFYDIYGNQTSSIGPTGITTTNVYDLAGRLTQAIDPLGNITTMEYLANDLPTKVTRTQNGVPHSVEYCYDANYNNIWIQDEKGQRTNMTYSFDEDYLTSIQFGPNTKFFSYTAKGLLETETTANGYIKTYQYNTNNELLENDGYASYEYDPNNRDNLIRIRLLSNPTQEYIEYFYDDFDRISHYTYYANGQNYSIYYTYDEASNVTSIRYPDYGGTAGMTVYYTYNRNNQLETVNALGMIWQAYRRADGSISKITYPNGMEKRYKYDNADRVDDLGYFSNAAAPVPSNTLSRQQFTIDDRGFFTQELLTGPSQPTLLPDLDVQFTQNAQNRVISKTNALTGQSATASFDSDGNQLSTDIGGTGAGTYTNMVWNAFEQLEFVQNTAGTFQANYTYGVLGQRNTAQRTRNGSTSTTSYFWEVSGVGNMLREERDVAGTITSLDYIHGFGEILARIPTGYSTANPPFSVFRDTVRFFVSDMRGTVIGLVDYDQNFTEQYEVTSYGEMISHEMMAGEVPNYFIFVGAYGVEWEDTSLYKMGVRYYDVEQVRFLSQDPIWNTNLHGYAGGNTVMRIDPDGKYLQAIVAFVYVYAVEIAAVTAFLAEVALFFTELKNPGSTVAIPPQYNVGGRVAMGLRGGAQLLKARQFKIFRSANKIKPNISTLPIKVSRQKQARHLIHSAEKGKSYFIKDKNAQIVLDAIHSGEAKFLGYTKKSKHLVYEYNGVTGINVNVKYGYSQNTNVFMIKGKSSVSVVPTDPNFNPF